MSLGSISQATTLLAFSSNLTVKFPVPGPTSSTTSDGLIFAYRNNSIVMKNERSLEPWRTFSTMALRTRGFFKMCCPKSRLNWIPTSKDIINLSYSSTPKTEWSERDTENMWWTGTNLVHQQPSGRVSPTWLPYASQIKLSAFCDDS
jgi:hypothetical protein